MSPDLAGLRSVVLPVLLLAACADDLAQRPMWSLEERPGLLLAIKQHYQANASEERGVCNGVLMDGVTRSELVSEDEDQVVVDVRYRYRSTLAAERRRGCSGFGERRFEAKAQGDRFEIVSMSGDYRAGLRSTTTR